MARQSLLTRPRAPHLSVVLNEAVLHRRVGDGGVMTEQLRRLAEAARQGNVSVRLLPWSAGVHGGLGAGSGFNLLGFPEDPVTGQPLEPPLAYVDSLTGAMYLTKPDQVGPYQLAWDDLDRKALDTGASQELIHTAIREHS
jgi:hypothetical protein